MKVNQLQDRAAIDELTIQITAKEEPREVRGGELKVCTCKAQDETGTCALTLWNDEIGKVNEGDTVKITKGWAQVYNDTMQVSAGKFGTLEVISSGGEAPAQSEPAAEQAEEQNGDEPSAPEQEPVEEERI